MKVLVTGGSGYLGNHVRRFFGAADLSRRSGSDILNVEDVMLVRDHDVVIHMASEMDRSSERADEIFRTNVQGTINVLKMMREGATFIFMSTKDIYGRFADGYGEVPETCSTGYAGQSVFEWSKLIAERYVEYYANILGFRSCIFRLSTPYAPMSDGNTPNIIGSFADALDKGEPLRLPGGGAPIRDPLHVDDISRAGQAFIDSGIRHGIYNLGGGRPNAAALTRIVALMEEASGLQAIVDADNPLPTPVPLNYVSDISLVDHELAWRPQVPLADGLRTLFERESPAA